MIHVYIGILFPCVVDPGGRKELPSLNSDGMGYENVSAANNEKWRPAPRRQGLMNQILVCDMILSLAICRLER